MPTRARPAGSEVVRAPCRRQKLQSQARSGSSRGSCSVSSTIAMLPQWQVPSSFALMAADYQPQLATLVNAPPAGGGWLHEVKYDGYRIGCSTHRRAVTLWCRRGDDWIRDLPQIVAA